MTAGRIAKAVFFMTNLDWLNEDVSVSWDKSRSRPVDITTPIKISRQNFIMNLN
jgi:hypothetical protein